MSDFLISVVIPVYRAEKMLDALVNDLSTELLKISHKFEIILVEDGSPDNSWLKIRENCEKHTRIKGIKLSRNFGQHNAITAGLEYSKGDWVVVMDCDFQDDPKYIPTLYNEALKGYDIVFAKRTDRTDGVIKKLTSKMFYKIFSYLTNSNFDGTIANYGIYSRKSTNAILSMKEPFKVFSLMARWVGFNTYSVEIPHGTRKEGESSYTYAKLIAFAFTIILTYSQKPLIVTIKTGLLMSVISLIFVIYNVIYWYFGKIGMIGYASLIASMWFIGGIIIFTLGILGLYLGKAFEGIKNRPVFIIDKVLNQ
ncbi:MAG: glycosyltransferase family 2 protein [Bacteroidetes bacterium]|nr:glycosyltransferase family 2 protein [Bacteroidota bacterium]